MAVRLCVSSSPCLSYTYASYDSASKNKVWELYFYEEKCYDSFIHQSFFFVMVYNIIPMWKVSIELFTFQLWINSRADCTL